MQKVNVKKLKPQAVLPTYGSEFAAGADLYACIENDILVGEIVNIAVDESILTDGKIDPKKMKPIVYDSANHTYYSLGELIGKAHEDGFKIK